MNINKKRLEKYKESIKTHIMTFNLDLSDHTVIVSFSKKICKMINKNKYLTIDEKNDIFKSIVNEVITTDIHLSECENRLLKQILCCFAHLYFEENNKDFEKNNSFFSRCKCI